MTESNEQDERSELNLWARQWRDECIHKARAELRRRHEAWQCLQGRDTDYARSLKVARDVAAQVLAVWEASPVDLPPLDAAIATQAQPALSAPWKMGNEFAPFHPDASHVPADYRDGWNACYAATQAQQGEVVLREALALAVRQNSHDMLMTGEELRQCEAALSSAAAPFAYPAAPPADQQGYVSAFYEMATMLGVQGPQSLSPEQVYKEQIKPALERALAAALASTAPATIMDAGTSAPARQAALTDERIDAVTRKQWGEMRGGPLVAHRIYARAILAEAVPTIGEPAASPSPAGQSEPAITMTMLPAQKEVANAAYESATAGQSEPAGQAVGDAPKPVDPQTAVPLLKQAHAILHASKGTVLSPTKRAARLVTEAVDALSLPLKTEGGM